MFLALRPPFDTIPTAKLALKSTSEKATKTSAATHTTTLTSTTTFSSTFSTARVLMLLPNKFLKVLLQVHSSRLSTLIHGSLNPVGKDNGENDEGNENHEGDGSDEGQGEVRAPVIATYSYLYISRLLEGMRRSVKSWESKFDQICIYLCDCVICIRCLHNEIKRHLASFHPCQCLSYLLLPKPIDRRKAHM